MSETGRAGEAGNSGRAARALRIGVLSLLVLGVEWRFADPGAVARDPELWLTPWAMLFMMVPVGLGVWVYEASTQAEPGFKEDGLWSVLVGTLAYVSMSLLG